MSEKMNFIVSRQQIFAVALAMAVATIFLNIMPLVLGGFQDKFHMDSQQAASIPAYTMVGYTLTVIVLAQLYSRVNWRWLIGVGLVMACVGLVSGAVLDSAQWLNPVALGIGVAIAIVYGTGMEAISFTREPEKAYGIVVFLSSLFASVSLYVSSGWILGIWGISGVLMMMALLCAGLVFFFPWIPRQAPPRATTIEAGERSLSTWLCLLGVVCFFAGYTAVFAFLERMGIAWGLDIEFIGTALAINSFVAATGCLVAAIMGARYGHVRSFIVGAVGVAASLLGLGGELGESMYFVTTFGFMFCFNFSLAYLWGWIAVCDTSETEAAYLPVAIGLGSIAGSVASGYLVDTYGFDGAIVFAVAMVVMAIGIYAYSGLKNKHITAQLRLGVEG